MNDFDFPAVPPPKDKVLYLLVRVTDQCPDLLGWYDSHEERAAAAKHYPPRENTDDSLWGLDLADDHTTTWSLDEPPKPLAFEDLADGQCFYDEMHVLWQKQGDVSLYVDDVSTTYRYGYMVKGAPGEQLYPTDEKPHVPRFEVWGMAFGEFSANIDAQAPFVIYDAEKKQLRKGVFDKVRHFDTRSEAQDIADSLNIAWHAGVLKDPPPERTAAQKASQSAYRRILEGLHDYAQNENHWDYGLPLNEERCATAMENIIHKELETLQPPPLSDDDWIHAAQALEQMGNDPQAQLGGDFKGNLTDAYRHIAKAYYHADLKNQKMMRQMFEPLFRTMLSKL